MRVALAVVALAFPLSLLAQEPDKPADKSAAKVELKVGTSVEGKEIAGAAEEFKIAPDTKLFAWAKVTGLAADSKVTLAFMKGDKEAFRKELMVGGSTWRLNAYKTFRAGDGGDWVAKLLGPDGAELASAKFKVDIQK
ncbi:MAG TPA: DUF2914 domain-containing protein [Thermoanaerobaculia bacterium]|nr:DUF2914 domain-containing protein [Thermoanaerobaculia bacterium]